MEEPAVYRNPNIREQTVQVLMERMAARRQRRLLIAVETNKLKQQKANEQADKAAVKFFAAIEKVEKALLKAQEALDKADNELAVASKMHNQINLFDNVGR